MRADDLTAIGTIRRTHGVQGEMKFEFDPFYADDLFGQHAIIIETGGTFLPFFIAHMEETSDGYGILKFEDIHSKEAAARFNGQEFFLQTKVLRMVKEDEFERYLGLEVCTTDNLELGKIEEVQELPGQLMLRIVNEDKEILIPLHDDFIHSLESQNNKLIVQLPEGYLDLF